MAVTPKRLMQSQQLGTFSASYYTATNVTTIIDKMTLTNTTAGAVAATIDLVDYGATAGVAYRVISARSIAPGETYTCPEVVGHILNAGDAIHGFAGSGSSLTIRASGREVSGA